MNLPEHSLQPEEARDGGGGVTWCFSFSCFPPQTPTDSATGPFALSCLRAPASPLLSHSHLFRSWEVGLGSSRPFATYLVLWSQHCFAVFILSALFSGIPSLSPTDSWVLWFFQGWFICTRSLGSCFFICILVNLEIEDTPVVEALW